MSKLSDVLLKLPSVHEKAWVNDQGNTVYRSFMDSDRYYFDVGLCKPAYAWKQYDTKQDAHYFGVWVQVEERQVFSYVEGDLSLVVCPTLESFKSELACMEKFYGPPPPMAVALSDDGTITKYYDTRPTA